MTGMIELGDRQYWMLLAVDLASHMEDKRLQSYGLIISKTVHSMYDDWKPCRYGAHSDQLGRDVDFFRKQGLVKVIRMRGRNVYFMSEKGKNVIEQFRNRCHDMHGGKVARILEIMNFYQSKPARILLAYAHQLFPEYAGKSTIKALVKDTISDYYVDLDCKQELEPLAPGTELEKFPYGDGEFRRKLAMEIGLKRPPMTDIKAYDRLATLFSDWADHDDDTPAWTRRSKTDV